LFTTDEGTTVTREFKKALNGEASESILNQLDAMKKYVLPPQFDFITANKEITKFSVTGRNLQLKVDPIAMYFFEFSYELTKDDLRKIWQNVAPEAKIREAEVTIAHELMKGEILEDIVSDRLQWLVFKVKKKAEWNYYKKTFDSRDDDRFKFDFQGNGLETVPDYSYNWPYDFCSVIEMAKLEANVRIESEANIKWRREGGFSKIIDAGKKAAAENLELLRDPFVKIREQNKSAPSVLNQAVVKPSANPGIEKVEKTLSDQLDEEGIINTSLVTFPENEIE
jgi:hypothetical protein